MDDIRREIEKIDLEIAELKKRRRALCEKLGAGRLSWGGIIAGAFGALMIGLGVIALFAANWDVFGREARAAIAVAPSVACGIAATVAAAKGCKSRAMWEPLGILWCVATIAGTCLVAQTYQAGGSVPGLVLFVGLLTLPVVWITRAIAPTVLWPVFAIVWGCASGHGSQSISLVAKTVAFMALSLPAFAAFARNPPPKAAYVSAMIVAGLVYSCGLGIALSGTLPHALLEYGDDFGFALVFWACAGIVMAAGRIFSFPAWGMVGTIVACGTAICTPFMETAAYAVALTITVLTIASGVIRMRLSLANVGAATLLYLLLAKFCESEVSFTVKGMVFILAGIALVSLNVAMVRFGGERKGGR